MHYNYQFLFTYLNKFNQVNLDRLNNNVQLILRNYENEFSNYEIKKFVNYCKKNKRKIYLSNDINRALKFGFDGVYIPAFNKLLKNFRLKIKKNFLILGSAHNFKELLIKEKQGAQIIFVSPLFETNKYNKNLGVVKFNLLTKNSKRMIIALGGINKKNLRKLNLLKINGFAGISYYKKN